MAIEQTIIDSINNALTNICKKYVGWQEEKHNQYVQTQWNLYVNEYAPCVREVIAQSVKVLPPLFRPISNDGIVENSIYKARCLSYGLWELELYTGEEHRKGQEYCNRMQKELQSIVDNMKQDAVVTFKRHIAYLQTHCNTYEEFCRDYILFYQSNFFRLNNYFVRNISFKEGAFYFDIEIQDSSEVSFFSPQCL